MERLTEKHLRVCFPKTSKQNNQVLCYSYFPFLFPFTAKNTYIWAFPVKDPPATAGDARVVGSVPWSEDPLEQEMATRSIMVAWEIPCEEKPRTQQAWGHREADCPFGVGEDLESPLDCKEIQPVHPKGYQSWMFFGRTDAEAEAPKLWPPDAKN